MSALKKMGSINGEKKRNKGRHWNEIGGGDISAETERMCGNEVMS